jgi:hypothetical protein
MTNRVYLIKSVPEITDSGKISFKHNEAVANSRSQINTWYLADDEGNPYTFISDKPHGHAFEYAVSKTWKFANRKQFRFTEDGTIEVRNLQLA